MLSLKHWLLRGRLPLILGESAADIQSFAGKSFNVTAVMATQLRAVSNLTWSCMGHVQTALPTTW